MSDGCGCDADSSDSSSCCARQCPDFSGRTADHFKQHSKLPALDFVPKVTYLLPLIFHNAYRSSCGSDNKSRC